MLTATMDQPCLPEDVRQREPYGLCYGRKPRRGFSLYRVPFRIVEGQTPFTVLLKGLELVHERGGYQARLRMQPGKKTPGAGVEITSNFQLPSQAEELALLVYGKAWGNLSEAERDMIAKDLSFFSNPLFHRVSSKTPTSEPLLLAKIQPLVLLISTPTSQHNEARGAVMRIWVMMLSLISPSLGYAGVFDMNVVYASDTLKATTESKSSLTAYDFAVGIPIGKNNIYVALNYGGFSSNSENSSTTTYSGTDLGVKFGGFFDRSKVFSSSFTYNLKSTVKFAIDGAAEELRGTSLKFDFGMNYWFSDTAAVGLKFYYYAPTLSESVVDQSLSKVSYSRASMGQALGLHWNF